VDAAWATTSTQDPPPGSEPWAHAFRNWSLANPQGFRLIFGDPFRLSRAEGGPAPEAARRICTGVTALAAAAWPHAEHLYADSEFEWSISTPGCSTTCARLPGAAARRRGARAAHPRAPARPGVAGVYGHLQTQTHNQTNSSTRS